MKLPRPNLTLKRSVVVNHRRHRHSGGFTLIELLVVCSVIAVMLAILLASLKPARDNTKAVICMSNIRQTGFLLHLYLGKKPIPLDLKSYRLNVKFTAAIPRDTSPGLGPVLMHVLPPQPPPTGSQGTGSGGDTTTFFGATGCLVAGDNPKFTLDPQNEPRRRSYGANFACLGKKIENAPDWLFADSDFAHIVGADELARTRHRNRVNLFFRDGHAALTLATKVKFETPPPLP